MITCILNPKKSNARSIIAAFHQGAVKSKVPCEVIRLDDGRLPKLPTRSIICFYGVDQITLPLWEEVQRRHQPYLYIDNGYFESKWKGGAYYRITANALQHEGASASDGRRFGLLHVKVAPPRTIAPVDSHVLIALQSDFWYTRFHMTKLSFIDQVKRSIADYADGRKIVVRDKTEHATPIRWEEVYCVVTHSSNVAVDGLVVAGVPCFTTSADCAARTMAGLFPLIDKPRYPASHDLLPWCWSLADNQWTVDEIAAGVPFAEGRLP